MGTLLHPGLGYGFLASNLSMMESKKFEKFVDSIVDTEEWFEENYPSLVFEYGGDMWNASQAMVLVKDTVFTTYDAVDSFDPQIVQALSENALRELELFSESVGVKPVCKWLIWAYTG